MALSLPANPDLERFRRDARRLQRGVRDRDPRALELVTRHHPERGVGRARRVRARGCAARGRPLLRLLQLAPAARLPAAQRKPASGPDDDRRRRAVRRRAVRRRAVRRRSGRRGEAGADAARVARAVLALACLRYDGADDPARWARAVELLRRHPALPGTTSSWPRPSPTSPVFDHTCGPIPVQRSRSGGPFDWPPLLYLAYSRVPQQDPLDVRAPAARRRRRPRQRLPVARGAATVHRPHRRLRRGRVGARVASPAIPPGTTSPCSCSSVAPTPTTGRPSTTGCSGATTATWSCCWTHGLGHPAGEVWAQRLGVAAESLEEMMQRQLHWAARHGFVSRTALLAAHGFTTTEVPAPAGGRCRCPGRRPHRPAPGRLHGRPGAHPSPPRRRRRPRCRRRAARHDPGRVGAVGATGRGRAPAAAGRGRAFRRCQPHGIRRR